MWQDQLCFPIHYLDLCLVKKLKKPFMNYTILFLNCFITIYVWKFNGNKFILGWTEPIIIKLFANLCFSCKYNLGKLKKYIHRLGIEPCGLPSRWSFYHWAIDALIWLWNFFKQKNRGGAWMRKQRWLHKYWHVSFSTIY